MANNIKKEKKKPTKTGHDIPPDDRNTTNTVLPKQSNPSGQTSGSSCYFSGKSKDRNEKKKKKVELFLSV